LERNGARDEKGTRHAFQQPAMNIAEILIWESAKALNYMLPGHVDGRSDI
jgi:hypothetical protein